MADELKVQADAEKKLGNEAYLARRFTEAKEHYVKAYELNKDVTYLTNLAAVLFEEGNYDECIAKCDEAVEYGRETRQDYKLIAKAFGRMGTAYVRKEDLDSAIKYFNKSLTEHRTPDILNKLKDAEKQKAEAARLAYIDPELSTKAREEGNALFKAGDFAESVKKYTEAVKRNPDEPRNYTNRAQSYTKLLALGEALKDSETAIKVDPTFVKGYIRRANVLVAMKDYDKAIEALGEAREKDTEKKNEREIGDLERKAYSQMAQQRAGESDEERLQRAMKDPEVQQIMSDPVMQSILQQAQNDPAALSSHMQNADVRRKIEKLAQAGIIRMGRA